MGGGKIIFKSDILTTQWKNIHKFKNGSEKMKKYVIFFLTGWSFLAVSDFTDDQCRKYCLKITKAYEKQEENRKWVDYVLYVLHDSNDFFSNDYKRWRCVFHMKEGNTTYRYAVYLKGHGFADNQRDNGLMLQNAISKHIIPDVISTGVIEYTRRWRSQTFTMNVWVTKVKKTVSSAPTYLE